MSSEDPKFALEFVYEDSEKLAELRPQLKTLVEEGSLVLEDEPDFGTCDETLTRFLRARNYDVKEAFKQLKETMEWRQQYRPLSVQCNWCETRPGYHSMRQIGHDRLGRPIVYACFAQAQTHKNSSEDSIAHTAYLIENAKKTMQKTGATMWVFVIDCTGMTLPCCNPKLGYSVAQACGSYYPERLGKILVLNHNIMFHHVWRAIRVFLDPKTAQKMKLVKNKAKLDKYLNLLCDEETTAWLKKEIELNEANISEGQLHFWQKRDDHDPRGTASYVRDFLEPLTGVKDLSEIQTDKHRPHPNMLSALMGKELKIDRSLKDEPLPEEDDPEAYGLSKAELDAPIEDQEESEQNGKIASRFTGAIKGVFNKFKL